MLPAWRTETRVGLCPDRLVLANAVHSTRDPLAQLRSACARQKRISVVVSNHYVRYAVLPHSSALASDDEWLAYARHTFEDIYGGVAAKWRIRVCPTGKQMSRVASAIDGELVDAIKGVPGVVSIQPYLMAAFNARRAKLKKQTTWFVLQEPGRLTLALIEAGAWRLIRTRRLQGNWRDALVELLDQEASRGANATSTLLCAEEETPNLMVLH